ncbi:CDP-alcohol phosphatidyltransferase family protein [Sphingomonas sp. PL-96]|uniref:CDP-alcohol phosphatidyltransferase family protein n=1 Tax=Sphingomonas sp. PL-96 TaxID=2887201 RepID=UPI001E41051B|nr:CDP-alcohol phosphatidyltransferase family protein [Sphingomonas sp. PL-96]MCC2975388.1 CDP-alcohol phosphatidyltransferase family protein [Sphingomonas sp. PL-96]
MNLPPPDQSRDRRIEDPTNLLVIHPAARRLLPWFLARGVSANAVSVGGLALGTLAACAYGQWQAPGFAVAGLLLSIAWLIADGLDGMIARATGTASALGRALDGLCDHGVFMLIYVVLASSIGTGEAWALACAAGVAHAVQSNLYESERARYHRRCKGVAATAASPSANPLVRIYDRVAGTLDHFAAPFDTALAQAPDRRTLAGAYGEAAARPMRLLRLMTANVRVMTIFIACLAGNPRLFWWVELVPLTAILILGLIWHRSVESRLVRGLSTRPAPSIPSSSRRT